jgi:hypothetical protein
MPIGNNSLAGQSLGLGNSGDMVETMPIRLRHTDANSCGLTFWLGLLDKDEHSY